jgi:hypothetical protein
MSAFAVFSSFPLPGFPHCHALRSHPNASGWIFTNLHDHCRKPANWRGLRFQNDIKVRLGNGIE